MGPLWMGTETAAETAAVARKRLAGEDAASRIEQEHDH